MGSGDPIEGPAGLEALAKGCIVFQPKHVPSALFAGKPTSRFVSSPIGGLVEVIIRPFVVEDSKPATIDVNNQVLVVVRIVICTRIIIHIQQRPAN